MTIRQQTTTFFQFLVRYVIYTALLIFLAASYLMNRCVGVIGGIWCCMTWTVRAGYKAIDVVSGADRTPGIVAAEATGVKRKWGGGEIRSRVTRQGSGWVVDSDSPYASQWNTPATATFPSPGLPTTPNSPYTNGSTQSSYGLGISSPAFGPRPQYGNHRPGSVNINNVAGAPLSSATYPASPYSQYSPNTEKLSPSEQQTSPGVSVHSPNLSTGLPSQGSPAGPPKHIRTESKKDD